MWCFYFAQANNTDGVVVNGTYSAWRSRNPKINKDALANTRRWFISTKKLTDIELQNLKKNLERQTTERQLTDNHSETAAKSEPETLDQPPKKPIDPETTFHWRTISNYYYIII